MNLIFNSFTHCITYKSLFIFLPSIRHIAKSPRSRFDLSNQRDGMGESASNAMEGLADSSSDLTYSPGAVQEVNGSSKYNKSM